LESPTRGCSGSKYLCVPGPAIQGKSSRAPSPDSPRLTLTKALLFALYRHSRRAENLHKGTASDIFIFPEKRGGEELSTPSNIIAQELCNNIRRSLVHDDVAKSITVMELQRTKEEWIPAPEAARSRSTRWAPPACRGCPDVSLAVGPRGSAGAARARPRRRQRARGAC